jgi:metal-responsive CopG/Arc/MetJ family transcriptional regulator
VKHVAISLPDDLAKELNAEAERRSSSVSEVVQMALTQYLGLVGLGGSSRKHESGDAAHSGKRTTARDIEELLAREWGDDAMR